MARVYDGKVPMKVAFMFSGGATGLKTTVIDNPDHGKLYEVSFCFTDKPECEGAEFVRELKRFPLENLEYANYRDKYTDKSERRRRYCQDVDRIMKDASPDFIVTSGFFLLLEDPFVRNWYGRLANGHPAKTYILSSSGGMKISAEDSPARAVTELHRIGYKRRFVGDNAVYDAVFAGEDDVRASVFFLDHGEDTGPNIVHSKPLPVDREYVERLMNAADVGALKTYSAELQEQLKHHGDGPAIRKALELAATGRLGLSDDVVNPQGLPYLVTLDDNPLPYGGLLL